MARPPQQRIENVGQALEQAREERIAAMGEGPGAVEKVVGEQIADALIGIRWALIGISSRLTKLK
jgi:hypothetical protein